MENDWETALKQGDTVKIKIKPIYDGSSLSPV